MIANAGVRFGTSLVILGAGPVAMGMCYFAKLYGAGPIVIVGRRDETLARFAKLGADVTLNNRTTDVAVEVKAMTAGHGADVVVDTTGDPHIIRDAGRLLAPNAKLVPYGVGDSFEYRVDRAAGPERWSLAFIGPNEERAHDYIIQLLRMKSLTLSTFYSHRMPFDRIADGFEHLRRGQATKVVFDMEDTGE